MLDQYISVYSCVVVRDPEELSAMAILGVREFSVNALPEDQQFDQFYNMEIGYPLVDVIGLQHVTGQTPESVLQRADQALDNDLFFIVQDKQLIADVALIGSTPLMDLVSDHGTIGVQIGGTKVSYDGDRNVYDVPMRDVVASIVGEFGRKGITVSGNLELADGIDQQLQSLTLGQEKLDPLMLAVGLGVWKISLEHKRETMYVKDKSSRGRSRNVDWANVGLRDG